MLILKRHTGMSCVVGEWLVTVVEIMGESVRIRVRFGPNVAVAHEDPSFKPERDESFTVKCDDVLDFAGEFRITICSVGQNSIRIGFDAPSDVIVCQLENYERAREWYSR